MAKNSLLKSRKAQFFIISAFTIVTILYFISKWMEPYTIIDTSAIAGMEEPFIFNNIMDKIHETIKNSKDIDELNYNLQEFESFVKEYGIMKNLDINFGVVNITEVTQMMQEATPADIMLTMDTSTSMDDDCPGGEADPGETPCKINDAKTAAKTFVDKLNSTRDRSGVVRFSATASVVQGLTSDKDVVKNAIDSLTLVGGTNIGDGIRSSTIELMKNGRINADWYQILLSDGQPTRPFSDGPSHSKDREYATNSTINATNEGVIMYTIGLGVGANGTFLKEIADITGGKYYFAPSGADLESIYDEIAKEILGARGIVFYCVNVTSPYVKMGSCRNETFA